MATTIRDTDHGYKALVERVYGFAKPSIDVGILAEDGSEVHGDDDVTIIAVATFNEFGTESIPARSFIRDWFDTAEPKLRQDLVTLMQSVIAGKRTKDEVLELLGQQCVGQIQERISEGIDPPNAPSTIRQKGSSTPLIDTGALRSAVNYRVNPGGGGG